MRCLRLERSCNCRQVMLLSVKHPGSISGDRVSLIPSYNNNNTNNKELDKLHNLRRSRTMPLPRRHIYLWPLNFDPQNLTCFMTCPTDHLRQLVHSFTFSVKFQVTFLDFWISQGSVATCCRWGRNHCHSYIENFITNQLAKEFFKIGPYLPKLLSNIKWLSCFWDTAYMPKLWDEKKVFKWCVHVQHSAKAMRWKAGI